MKELLEQSHNAAIANAEELEAAAQELTGKAKNKLLATAQGLRDGAARTNGQLQALALIPEPTIEELAQQQAAAKIRQIEINKRTDEIVQQATQKT